MKPSALALSLLAFVAACSTHRPESLATKSAGPRRAQAADARRARTVRTGLDRASAATGRDAVRRRSAAERVDPVDTAALVLAEVNAARRRAGSRPLWVDPALSRAARRYARELAAREEIEHASRTPGRRTFRQRIAAEGGRARVAGENLARLSAGAASLPKRAVRAWLRSPGHRTNLLDPVFARTGIGVWLGSDGIWYIVQEFATAD